MPVYGLVEGVACSRTCWHMICGSVVTQLHTPTNGGTVCGEAMGEERPHRKGYCTYSNVWIVN